MFVRIAFMLFDCAMIVVTSKYILLCWSVIARDLQQKGTASESKDITCICLSEIILLIIAGSMHVRV